MHEVGLGVGLAQGAAPPHTYTCGTSNPVCLGLILWPVAPPPFLCSLCVFILGEVVAGCRHHHVWLAARICWVLSMDFLSYGRRFCCGQEPASCSQVRLFAFPPPLVGAELERKRDSCRFL
jgi:hypothetical protein